MARKKLRILANSGRGAFAVQFHGLTRRAASEIYLPDGTLCYEPDFERGEAMVAPGTVERHRSTVPVLVPEKEDGTGALYLHDVSSPSMPDGGHVVPDESAVLCPHCGAWTAPALCVGVHYDTCPASE